MPKILNQHDLQYIPYNSIYIGRNRTPNQHFGNPFSHLLFSKASVVVSTREEAITAFRQWILGMEYQWVEPERRKWILDNLESLRGKDLICWCSPLSCHGEVYLEMLYEQRIASDSS